MKTFQHDADFEIEFYERILETRPHFTEALSTLGDLYTKAGRYQDGLRIDQLLARLRPSNPEILYNLACSYSLLNDAEKAFGCVKRAIDLGYQDLEYLQKDDDLKNLRQLEGFQRYFDELWQKYRERQRQARSESMQIFKDQ